MKRKLNQSAKISFKHKLLIASTALGFFAAVALMVFLYLNFGNTREAKAATANIGGIINSYASVTDITSNQITISNLSGSHSDFGVGAKVLIIQMKGASINTTNSSSYGNITAYNDAGNYEFATVTNKSGSSPIYIITVDNISNSYDTDGYVQLVSVPQYDNAVVTSTITTIPWNNSEGRGGIIAFEVQKTLTIGASINANAMGFAGGLVNTTASSASDPADNVTYRSSDTKYAQKGEGIADYQGSKAFAMGKLANGGGGGNINNAGGGGGGNFTTGGLGGGSFAGASGSGGNGIGGSNLTYSPSSKLFLGGGGGGGQQDGGTATPGGNGGGIIIIRAGTITSTCGATYSISANGASSANTTGAGNDGAGGGGAGGTILIEALDYNLSCDITVTTNGGNGGSVANATSHGGGGGGGTGANLFTATPESHVIVSSIPGTGGANCSGCGTSASPGGTCLSPTCSQTGWSVAGDQLLLPVDLLSFAGKMEENNIRLDWTTSHEVNNDYFTIERSADGKTFESLETVKGKGNATEKNDYHFTDRMPQSNINYYRLKQTDFNGQFHYSKTISIINSLSQENMQDIIVSPNPFEEAFKVKFNLKTSAAIKLQIRRTNGNLVTEKSMNGVPGKNEFVFQDEQGLSKGSYLLAIIPKDSKLQVVKLIKK